VASKSANHIGDGHYPEAAYVLLSGVARITRDDRKGGRTAVLMVAPGLIPGFLRAYLESLSFRCGMRLRTARLERSKLIEISFGDHGG
jgi:hypothetical protein